MEDSPRRKKMAKRDAKAKKAAWVAQHVTPRLESVEEGLWPWGKHQGTPFDATPRGYVEFMMRKLADKLKEEPESWGRPLTEAILGQLKGLDLEQLPDDRVGSTSKHLGTVGDRLEFTEIVLKSKKYFDGDYGGTELVLFEDTEGNILKYWGGLFMLDDPGARVSFKATVKSHDEFCGIKQTTVSRPSGVDVASYRRK
jgi:hypothetical protein